MKPPVVLSACLKKVCCKIYHKGGVQIVEMLFQTGSGIFIITGESVCGK
ncbi:DUF6783 domain-containing protein [Blautia faecis]